MADEREITLKQDGLAESSSNDDDTEISVFLHDVFSVVKAEKPQVYDVDTEFAKSRKNHSWFVILLVAGAAALAVLALWIGTVAIGQDVRDVPVEIEVFDDLNLQKLLDSVTRVETSLKTETEKRDATRAALGNELAALNFRRESEKNTVLALNLDNTEKERQIAAIDTRYSDLIVELERKYAPELDALDSRIADYERQMAAFDSRRVEEAQALQRAANAAELRYTMELESARAHYEKIIADMQSQLDMLRDLAARSGEESLGAVADRYGEEIAALRAAFDPVFQDEHGAYILQNGSPWRSYSAPPAPADEPPESAPSGESAPGEPADIPPAAESSTGEAPAEPDSAEPDAPAAPVPQPVYNEAVFNYAAQSREYIGYLSDILLTIPWEHSAPDYVTALRGTAFDSIDGFIAETRSYLRAVNAQTAAYDARIAELEALGLEKDARIAELNREVAAYRSFLKALAERNGDTGYIIEAGSPNRIVVYIDPLYGSSFQDRTAYVFRTGSEYIGSIAVTGSGGAFTARVLSLEAGKKLQNGDRIMLNMAR
jgi:hypothetical protein